MQTSTQKGRIVWLGQLIMLIQLADQYDISEVPQCFQTSTYCAVDSYSFEIEAQGYHSQQSIHHAQIGGLTGFLGRLKIMVS